MFHRSIFLACPFRSIYIHIYAHAHHSLFIMFMYLSFLFAFFIYHYRTTALPFTYTYSLWYGINSNIYIKKIIRNFSLKHFVILQLSIRHWTFLDMEIMKCGSLSLFMPLLSVAAQFLLYQESFNKKCTMNIAL